MPAVPISLARLLRPGFPWQSQNQSTQQQFTIEDVEPEQQPPPRQVSIENPAPPAPGPVAPQFDPWFEVNGQQFTIEDVPAPTPASQSFSDQVAELFKKLAYEVNFITPAIQASQEAAQILKESLHTNLQEFMKTGDPDEIGPWRGAKRAVEDVGFLASSAGEAQAVPYTRAMDSFKLAKEAYHKGDARTAAALWAEGLIHAKLYWLPFVGPRFDEGFEEAQKGNWGASTGILAGAMFNLLGPSAISNLVKWRGAGAGRSLVPPPAPRVPAPDVAAFAQANRIPITAGEATGSRVLQGAEQWLQNTSPSAEAVFKANQAQKADAIQATGQRIGAQVHSNALTAETGGAAVKADVAAASDAVMSAYTRLAEKLTQAVHPAPQTPFMAGEFASGSLNGKMAQWSRDQQTHYQALEKLIEDNPALIEDVVVEYVSPQTSPGFAPLKLPVTAKVQLPVQIGPVKDGLRSVYQDFIADPEWTLPRRQASPGFNALEQLMNGPEAVPLVRADKMLSAIKRIAREKGGVAKLAVGQLEQQVQRALAKAGPEAVEHLRKGREATKAKYAVEEVLAKLKDEPVKTFSQLTEKFDGTYKVLESVVKEVPEVTPVLGRALVESILDIALAEGKFDFTKAAMMKQAWQQGGDKMKKLLFTPPEIQQLDKFFDRAAKWHERTERMTKLPPEPVRAFDSLVAPHDGNIVQLRTLAKLAPDIPHKLGRAWLDEKLHLIGEEASEIKHGAKAYAEWNKLGPGQKSLFFGPGQRALHTFFQLIGDISYIGNTSKTAYAVHIGSRVGMILADPALGTATVIGYEISAATLAKLLTSPKFTEHLIRAMRTPKTMRAQSAQASAAVIDTARKLGVELNRAQLPPPALGASSVNMLNNSASSMPRAAEDQQPQAPAAQASPSPVP